MRQGPLSSLDGRLVEAVEPRSRPFYIGVQYHPEFKSRPNRVRPLFKELVAAALKADGQSLQRESRDDIL